jgi:ribose 5-phosphate isomerase A
MLTKMGGESGMGNNVQDLKQAVGAEIAKRVRSGEVLAVGTGTTADAAIAQIGERIKNEKLNIAIVTTSLESAWRCQAMGMQVLDFGYMGETAWGFDGVDEVDQRLRVIKGQGGAMLREKLLAARCKHWVVIGDERKLVKRLGEKFPVPVEIIPAARFAVERELAKMGAKEIKLRYGSGIHGPAVTEYGNIILDVRFDEIHDQTEGRIKQIVGVVETGIFTNYAAEALIATAQGIQTLEPFK